MATLPTHGSFTQYPLWCSVEQAISDFRRRNMTEQGQMSASFDAKLLFSDWESRLKGLKIQYTELQDENEWPEWRGINRDLIKRLLIDNQCTHSEDFIDSLALDAFLNQRADFDKGEKIFACFKDFLHYEGMEIYPFFCWITEEAAVFSLRSEDKRGKYTGSGIYTEDRNLIDALETAFNFYLDNPVGEKGKPKLIQISRSTR